MVGRSSSTRGRQTRGMAQRQIGPAIQPAGGGPAREIPGRVRPCQSTGWSASRRRPSLGSAPRSCDTVRVGGRRSRRYTPGLPANKEVVTRQRGGGIERRDRWGDPFPLSAGDRRSRRFPVRPDDRVRPEMPSRGQSTSPSSFRTTTRAAGCGRVCGPSTLSRPPSASRCWPSTTLHRTTARRWFDRSFPKPACS